MSARSRAEQRLRVGGVVSALRMPAIGQGARAVGRMEHSNVVDPVQLFGPPTGRQRARCRDKASRQGWTEQDA
jgi:hypothetical protein